MLTDSNVRSASVLENSTTRLSLTNSLTGFTQAFPMDLGSPDLGAQTHPPMCVTPKLNRFAGAGRRLRA
ncbi:hypothetical protein EOA13_13325 [Mesorhizobium sp. M7A.F.Ca.US.011.01.1.1]|nr:hypothetical protein EOA13_13325 [Mesorhizobium sp. M7A.F.Ca.US.011.01.1.1]